MSRSAKAVARAVWGRGFPRAMDAFCDELRWIGEFDAAAADRLMGARVLVGLTYLRGNDVEQVVQFHGTVVKVSQDGIEVQPSGGDEVVELPPDLDAFEPAVPGEYRLRSTGEVVIDPDFTCAWSINSED
jgi:hypothetical protein